MFLVAAGSVLCAPLGEGFAATLSDLSMHAYVDSWEGSQNGAILPNITVLPFKIVIKDSNFDNSGPD